MKRTALRIIVRSTQAVYPAGALAANGYVVVMVNACGTGTWGGDRLIEGSPDEIADYGPKLMGSQRSPGEWTGEDI